MNSSSVGPSCRSHTDPRSRARISGQLFPHNLRFLFIHWHTRADRLQYSTKLHDIANVTYSDYARICYAQENSPILVGVWASPVSVSCSTFLRNASYSFPFLFSRPQWFSSFFFLVTTAHLKILNGLCVHHHVNVTLIKATLRGHRRSFPWFDFFLRRRRCPPLYIQWQIEYHGKFLASIHHRPHLAFSRYALRPIPIHSSFFTYGIKHPLSTWWLLGQARKTTIFLPYSFVSSLFWPLAVPAHF